MISSGIHGVDDMLGGGIPGGSRVLHSMEPGADGQLFMVPTFLSAPAPGLSFSLAAPGDTPRFFLSARKTADEHQVLESMVDNITQFSY